MITVDYRGELEGVKLPKYLLRNMGTTPYVLLKPPQQQNTKSHQLDQAHPVNP